MAKRIISILLVLAAIFVLAGCSTAQPLPETEDSTFIKNPKKISEYLKKEDYKSIAYAYLYNTKEGAKSYKISRSGTLKGKVLFIDYEIEISSSEIKKGNSYYGKYDSVSPLTTVHGEFYMNDKTKILTTNDLKDYKVYSMEDYHKTTYSPDQDHLLGYVFNDKSILKGELVSHSGGIVTIKYTLDNDLATRYAKLDIKTTGDLSDYPKFSSVVFTLTMKEDYTPVSYSVDAVYEVSKPILGSATVTQHLDCRFDSYNESIEIPNESSLIEKLGQKPSELVENKEATVKDQLLSSLSGLSFDKGLNIDGALTMEVTGMKFSTTIETSTLFDVSKLNDENLYSVLKFHSKLAGDNTFNSLIGIINGFAGDKLGEYKELLSDFAGLDVYYTGDGAFYIIPYNAEHKVYSVLKLKLTDVVDLILSKVNIYNLISGSNKDLVTFEKEAGSDDKNYSVNVLLNEDTIASIRKTINEFFSNPDYAMIKTLLGYEDFGSIDVRIDVKDGTISKVYAGVNYLKTNPSTEEGSKPIKTTLIELVLETKALNYDFAKLSEAKPIVDAYDSVQALKAKLKSFISRPYLSKGFANDAAKIIEEYNALSETQKLFIPDNQVLELKSIKEKIEKTIGFLDTCRKYDYSKLSNRDIIDLSKAYTAASVDSKLIIEEYGQEYYDKLVSLSSLVDYSTFDSAIAKIKSADEKEWNLTPEELSEIKVLIELAEVNMDVRTSLFMKLFSCPSPMDFDTFAGKINNLTK